MNTLSDTLRCDAWSPWPPWIIQYRLYKFRERCPFASPYGISGRHESRASSSAPGRSHRNSRPTTLVSAARAQGARCPHAGTRAMLAGRYRAPATKRPSTILWTSHEPFVFNSKWKNVWKKPIALPALALSAAALSNTHCISSCRKNDSRWCESRFGLAVGGLRHFCGSLSRPKGFMDATDSLENKSGHLESLIT